MNKELRVSSIPKFARQFYLTTKLSLRNMNNFTVQNINNAVVIIKFKLNYHTHGIDEIKEVVIN